jgi:hypothetical protein
MDNGKIGEFGSKLDYIKDTTYIGYFVDEKMSGEGNWSDNTGVRSYVGKFKNNEFNGEGVFKIEDRTVEGSFQDGKLIGKVIETTNLGETYVGYWENN